MKSLLSRLIFGVDYPKIIANIIEYDDKLEHLELPPNGDDYNNVVLHIRGNPLVLPNKFWKF